MKTSKIITAISSALGSIIKASSPNFAAGKKQATYASDDSKMYTTAFSFSRIKNTELRKLFAKGILSFVAGGIHGTATKVADVPELEPLAKMWPHGFVGEINGVYYLDIRDAREQSLMESLSYISIQFSARDTLGDVKQIAKNVQALQDALDKYADQPDVYISQGTR